MVIFKTDYLKEIEKLDTTKEYLADRNPELIDAIHDKIDDLGFTILTKYKWSKNRRSDFWRIYKLVKDDLNLKSII